MRDAERDAEFTDFVHAQRPALVRMARLLTAGDEALAEDLVQTTLTRLYVAWPRVRRAGNPVGYARTTLTHASSTSDGAATGATRRVTEPRPTGPRARPSRASPPTSSPRCAGSPRASARSSCSGTGSTSTSPRPPGCSAAPPGP